MISGLAICGTGASSYFKTLSMFARCGGTPSDCHDMTVESGYDLSTSPGQVIAGITYRYVLSL
jgi:hypothetical protein